MTRIRPKPTKLSPDATSSELPISINRESLPSTLLPFTDYFKGFEKVGAVRSVFGDKTDAVLANLKVGFLPLKFAYMGISDEDGALNVGTYHLKNSDTRTLYLDIVHELFHIKQWQEDKEYFEKEHRKFMGDWSLYFASQIEVPAYKHTVWEAERIGMTRDEIVEHLKMGPTAPNVFAKFLKEMNIANTIVSSGSVRLPVRINRKALVTKFRFTDFFEGFDKVDAVRKLFGDRASEFLSQLRVEFIRGSFVTVIPSDEGGRLVVSASYLKDGDPISIYLDVLLSLNIIKRASLGRRTPKKTQVGLLDDSVLFESYVAMLEEARRLKVSDAKVLEHMNIPRFLMGSNDFQKFLQKLKLRAPTKVVKRP